VGGRPAENFGGRAEDQPLIEIKVDISKIGMIKMIWSLPAEEGYEAYHQICNRLRSYGLCLGPSGGSDGDGFDAGET